MNFIKWILIILYEKIIYLSQINHALFSSHSSNKKNIKMYKFYNLELILLLSLFIFIGFMIDEEWVNLSLYGQMFIQFMSSYLPGIKMMSRDSCIPLTTSFELSIAYAILPLMTFIFFYRVKNEKEKFMTVPLRQIIFINTLGICILFLISYISLQETNFLFDPNKDSRLLGLITQTNIGLSIFVWLVTWMISQLLGNVILMSQRILKELRDISRPYT